MAVDWDTAVIGPVTEVFGEPATYLPAAGGSYPITAVFDRAYREIGMLDDTAGVTTQMPVLGVQLSQFPTGVQPVQGDQVTIVSANLTFNVKEVRTDGHGHAKLMLNRAS